MDFANIMGLHDITRYLITDNPVSKSVISLFKTNKMPITTQTPQVVVKETQKVLTWNTAPSPYVRLAGLMGAAAVALGAYGAHRTYPKGREDELKPIFETGNRYHLFHTLALFAVPMARYPLLSGSLFVTGASMFCGTCYYRAFTGDNQFGKLAPIGGTILIIAWLSLVL